MKPIRLTGAFNHFSNLRESPVFRPGQIFRGEITKLFPGQTAEVQIGNVKLIAQLKSPLSENEQYLFQVQPGEGKIHLKVLPSIAEAGGRPLSHPVGVLTQFKMPITKENLELVRFFLNEQLPLAKEILQLSGEWLNAPAFNKAGLDVIKQMLIRDLPFIKEVFNALSSLEKSEPMYSLVNSLLASLKGENLSDTGNKLNSLLKLFTTENNGSQAINFSFEEEKAELIASSLKSVISKLGLNHERHLIDYLQNPANYKLQEPGLLKPLLIRFINEQPGTPQKEAAEELLNRITGLQAFSQEAGPILQFAIQVPFSLWSKTADLTMQWSGRKKPDGKLDPSYCRILFYLDLEHLQETMVDMQVQNRVMRITVINENPQIKDIALPFINGLKEQLAKLDYRLSTVYFETVGDRNEAKAASNNKQKPVLEQHSYQGVDLRI